MQDSEGLVEGSAALITTRDLELIRQSRSRDKYVDFSADEQAAYRRVHEALDRLGKMTVDKLGGARDYVLKLTSGFHPKSGIRGGKPKDLWFGVYRKENEERFLGNPQIFMIVSSRGIEWGFSPLTHPDDFSNQELRRRTREIAKLVLDQLPTPQSPEAERLAAELSKPGKWHFRRKQRLDPNQSEFRLLADWLSFLRSDEGVRNAGGSISSYALLEEIDGVDLMEEVQEMAELFRPLMERVIADAPPAAATQQGHQAATTPVAPSTLSAFGDLLQVFLRELAEARSGPFEKTDALWNAMAEVKRRLEQFPAVHRRPNLLVDISVGQGNWADVPWIALLNTKVTTSTQEGIYVVFLIATGLDHVFLTLNQGATKLVRGLGQREAQKQMIDIAGKTRHLISDLEANGFALDNDIKLGSDSWRPKNYEIGAIAHMKFALKEVPNDEKMNELLEAVLSAYDRAVDESPAETPTFGETADDTLPSLEPYGMEAALSDLFFERPLLERILTIWAGKKNLILQGPPGVGKSFIAKRLAYLLLEEKNSGRIESVQFHQSYSYEDFVQGYRPDGKGGFRLRDGVFHRFCEKARLSPSRKHVFIVDEINRGNLSKILGELMLLVEPDKRGPDWSTSLTYSQPDEPRFFVPENIYLLGMMNTADRSLSLVDYALRRRFSFVSLEPMFGSSKFKGFLIERGVPESIVDLIVTRMTTLNLAIGEDRANLGPRYRIGHSFFVPREDFEYDAGWYRRIVETEIDPLLEEYCIDDPDKADSWREQLLQGAP